MDMNSQYPMTIEFGRLIWEKCTIGLAEVDLEGKWLAVNPMLCSLLEYTESELQSRTFQQITHPEDIDDDVYMTNRVKDGVLDFFTMSKRYITKTGQVIWIKLRVDPVKDEEGNVVFFLSQVTPAKHVPMDALERNIVENKSFKIGQFVKSEWKWLITAIIAIVGFAGAIYAERAVNIEKVKHMEEEQKTIKTEVKDMKSDIKKILEKISK